MKSMSVVSEAQILPVFRISEALHFDFDEFLQFWCLSFTKNQYSLFSVLKIVNFAILRVCICQKFISRKNLSDRKIPKFPHWNLDNFLIWIYDHFRMLTLGLQILLQSWKSWCPLDMTIWLNLSKDWINEILDFKF